MSESETKPVVRISDDRKPNIFFFRSPFYSWKFLINTGLIAVVCIAFAAILWKYWDKLNQKSSIIWLILFTLLIQNVVYPFWGALRRHRKINDLYVAGQITEQVAGSPLDEVLDVADNAINEGLRNTMFMFGLYLLSLVLWKLG